MDFLRITGLALSVLWMASLVEAGQSQGASSRGNASAMVTGGHLSVASSIRDTRKLAALEAHRVARRVGDRGVGARSEDEDGDGGRQDGEGGPGGHGWAG